MMNIVIKHNCNRSMERTHFGDNDTVESVSLTTQTIKKIFGRIFKIESLIYK